MAASISPTTRGVSASSAARRSSTSASAAAAVDHPRARLADRPGAGLPEDAVLDRSDHRRSARRSSRSTTWRSRECFRATILPELGLGWEVLDIQALEYWGQISYLKGGINFSERITTVSPTYAREILTPELGFGLDGALLRRCGRTEWNPERRSTSSGGTPEADDLIGASFSADDLSGKAARQAGSARDRRPAGGRRRAGAAASSG